MGLAHHQRVCQDWLIFPGNHDMFMRHTWDVNSLRPIKRLITLIDDVALVRIGGRRFRIIPFIQNEQSYMTVVDAMSEKAEDGEILLTHIGVTKAKYNSCFLMQHWGSIGFEHTKFDKVFAGHFHCQQHFDNIYIPGSPLPFRFDEGMVPHGFYQLDCESGEAEFINISIGESLIGGNAPPDFITITESTIDELEKLDRTNVRIILDTTKSRDELDRIRQKLESQGASKVTWMKAKEQEQEMPGETEALEPMKLFETFIDHDKPKGMNRELLITLNKQIVEEAFNIDADE
jgi:hypothetical protein